MLGSHFIHEKVNCAVVLKDTIKKKGAKQHSLKGQDMVINGVESIQTNVRTNTIWRV